MENKNERFVYILLLLILCLASFGLGFYMFKMSDAKEARPVPVNDSITLNAKPIMPGDGNKQLCRLCRSYQSSADYPLHQRLSARNLRESRTICQRRRTSYYH